MAERIERRSADSADRTLHRHQLQSPEPCVATVARKQLRRVRCVIQWQFVSRVRGHLNIHVAIGFDWRAR